MVFFLLSISSIINSLSSLTAITGCAPSNLKFWYRLCREREREREERERERERGERERERERESSTVDKFYYSINKYVYMEGTAFVISVEKTILTPTLRSINIFF